MTTLGLSLSDLKSAFLLPLLLILSLLPKLLWLPLSICGARFGIIATPSLSLLTSDVYLILLSHFNCLWESRLSAITHYYICPVITLLLLSIQIANKVHLFYQSIILSTVRYN